MPIKNYTSTVPIGTSIMRIEHRLAQAGALNISKKYADDRSGRPVGMVFQIMVNNRPVVFKLPAKTDLVYKYLKNSRKRTPTKSQDENLRMQADRTAWKLLFDWIDMQVSMIELDQLDVIEAFLQHSYDAARDQTFYEKLKTNDFKLLNM